MSGPNAADWAVFATGAQSLRACLQKWPSQRSADLVILNRGHGALVGMGVKLRTNHAHESWSWAWTIYCDVPGSPCLSKTGPVYGPLFFSKLLGSYH